MQKVEAGSQLVSRTGAAMDDIFGSIKRVTVFVSEMDQATQHTATLMTRTADAARRLEDQARGLLEGVARLQAQQRRFWRKRTSRRGGTTRPDALWSVVSRLIPNGTPS